MTTSPHDIELTILMPCLDEAETIEACIDEARAFLEGSGIVGEVLIADNGSTDGSQALAEAHGARVVAIEHRGYGNALAGGIAAARGRFVAMGDADGSYNFGDLGPFVEHLRDGAQLVVGNRFEGGIADGAMPALHRYLGTPVISYLGRLFFGIGLGDFNCGLRAVDRQSILDLGLQTTGMEFASEMIVRSALGELVVEEVPATLRRDGRTREPHLRTWSDGWRHLRFMLLFSPRWLFQIPGFVLMALALVLGTLLSLRQIDLGPVTLSSGSLVLCGGAFIIGVQALQFDTITRAFALTEGYRPLTEAARRRLGRVTFERGLLTGSLLILVGLFGIGLTFNAWRLVDFGNLSTSHELRFIVPSMVAIVAGFQVALTGMFVSLLKIRSDLN